MHPKVLPRQSKGLLAKLEKRAEPALSNWTVAGDTGLALRLGHRVSEDLDFFRTDKISPLGLHDVFREIGQYETLQESEHTLTVIISGTKLSFFRVKDPFLFKPDPYGFFVIADVRDIALMKLAAVSGRGSRKDFVDLFTIVRSGIGLQELFSLLPKKYGHSRTNTYHILKSLTYFEDAEKEPMPVMLEPFNWKECKAFFIREAQALILPTRDKSLP